MIRNEEQQSSMTVVVETDHGEVTWTPHIDEEQGAVGWMAVNAAGEREYVYLLPSSEIDSGGSDRHADVFFYQGSTGQPWNDGAVCFVDVFETEEP